MYIYIYIYIYIKHSAVHVRMRACGGSPNSHFLLISMIKGSSAGAETWIFGCS